ncbi:NAD-dependent epimerase/dehydratase family protein [Planomonospora sp. ID67723]|uniref:NAD-dependent epimerase/dehydratase family protein n=1 Tax=Planomonospora sp. ID67723 TaxID=2738134 RepID=UPI0018C3DAFE|nr:NAD-dependent epimerase/dehydratase family protein [Planomonospora sp. ID67723]MBG0827596.1 NAD-dependent epimerase/dehydratase family protein [Planomonospora sp. ID67723]
MRLLILGAGGFIGRTAVREAAAAGWEVTGLVRTGEAARRVAEAGGTPHRFTVTDPGTWAETARDARAVIDLIQPRLPARMTRRAARQVGAARRETTSGVLRTLGSLPADRCPLLVSVSGVDDLDPGEERTVSHTSPLRTAPYGFARIGLPVRRLIEQSGLPAVHVYLGNMVYGPGKGFGDVIVPGLARRRIPVLGSGNNRLPIVHVEDAARALVHVAGLDGVAGRSFVATDGTATTLGELFGETARLLGAPAPRRLPRWLTAAAVGGVAAETLTLDTAADVSALAETGFVLRHPSIREGLPATLEEVNR